VTPGNPRQGRAQKLCAAAVRLFQNNRNVELDFSGSTIKAHGLTIAYRIPLQKWPDRQNSRTMPVKDEPYGIDIWAPRKVLSVVWHDSRKQIVVSYKPGEWESRLEALAEGNESSA
jgi:hypothetical protein